MHNFEKLSKRPMTEASSKPVNIVKKQVERYLHKLPKRLL